MQQLFSGKPTGAPFQLFDIPHVTALLLVLATNLGIIIFRKRIRTRLDMIFRIGLISVLLIDETIWHAWNLATGQWTLQTMLPFHLCSVMVFLCSALLMTENRLLYQFAYLIGIAGALQALLTPDIGAYGFPHFRFFQVMVSHGAIITTAVYMTAVAGLRPTLDGVKRVILWGNVYMLAIGIVNRLLGSNYLFIARKPETASLLDALPPWPWYILYIEGLALILVLAFYLPFRMAEGKRVEDAMLDSEASLTSDRQRLS